MSGEHARALAECTVVYAVALASCAGWGRIAMRLHGGEAAVAAVGPLLPWVGWCAVLLLLQLLHFVVPLTAPWAVAVLLPGVVVTLRQGLCRRQPVYRVSIRRLAWLAVLGALAWLVAVRSMRVPTLFDAGLYYLSTLRWICEYPLVPGLGNLHGRLAFNQSHFLWAAALSFHPVLGHGRALANSVLLLLAGATLARAGFGGWRPGADEGAFAVHRIAAVLALPVLLVPLFSLEALTAPAPDTVVLLLQLVLGVALMRELAGLERDPGCREASGAAITLLAATVVTVKLSALAYAGAVGVICVLGAARRGGAWSAVRVALPATIVLGVWVVRGYVLSGTPAYPSAFARIAFDWAMPVARIEDEAHWIYSWARVPGAHWSDVLGNREWIGPWWSRIRSNDLVVYPVAVGAALAACAALLAARFGARHAAVWLALLPGVAGIGFWFLAAPDPRFALGTFWAVGVAGATVFLHYLRMHAQVRVRIFKGAFLAVFVILCRPLLERALDGASLLRLRSSTGWAGMPAPELEQRVTASGLRVSVATVDGRCWDAPLPCTPLFDPALELRRPGEPGAGFRVASGARR